MATITPELCAVPDCGEPRVPLVLGWHGNDAITSAYCEFHGPRMKVKYCPECGQETASRQVWPDGIPPAGVLNGKAVTVTAK